MFWAACAAAALAPLLAVPFAPAGDRLAAVGIWAALWFPAVAYAAALLWLGVTAVWSRDPETGRVVWNDTSHGSTQNELLSARLDRTGP